MMAKPIHRRRGITLILALVLMATLTVIFAVLTMEVVSQHRMLAARQRQLQANWLARSGVELAVARLMEKPDAYSEVNKDLLPDAFVRIEVKEAEKDTYVVTVDVRLGEEDERPVAATISRRFRRTESDGVIRMLHLATD
jgi:hypothetical protein